MSQRSSQTSCLTPRPHCQGHEVSQRSLWGADVLVASLVLLVSASLDEAGTCGCRFSIRTRVSRGSGGGGLSSLIDLTTRMTQIGCRRRWIHG